jgi:hypothetical protein
MNLPSIPSNYPPEIPQRPVGIYNGIMSVNSATQPGIWMQALGGTKTVWRVEPPDTSFSRNVTQVTEYWRDGTTFG